MNKTLKFWVILTLITGTIACIVHLVANNRKVKTVTKPLKLKPAVSLEQITFKSQIDTTLYNILTSVWVRDSIGNPKSVEYMELKYLLDTSVLQAVKEHEYDKALPIKNRLDSIIR